MEDVLTRIIKQAEAFQLLRYLLRSISDDLYFLAGYALSICLWANSSDDLMRSSVVADREVTKLGN